MLLLGAGARLKPPHIALPPSEGTLDARDVGAHCVQTLTHETLIAVFQCYSQRRIGAHGTTVTVVPCLFSPDYEV